MSKKFSIENGMSGRRNIEDEIVKFYGLQFWLKKIYFRILFQCIFSPITGKVLSSLFSLTHVVS